MAALSGDEKGGLDVSTEMGHCTCTHSATEAVSKGYGGEIPSATLATHSSSPAKKLSLDTATSFPNSSAVAIPYISPSQQLLLVTGLGKKDSGYLSAIDTGQAHCLPNCFQSKQDNVLKAV